MPAIELLEAAERPVVGIQTPVVRLDQDQPMADHELWAWDTEREIRQATHVIHSLRSTGLFREVDFICSLSVPPDVAVEVESPPRGTGSFERWYFWLITVGIVPVTETHEEGVYFKRIGPGPSFAFAWPVNHVVGWAALPLHFLSNWHFDQTMSQFAEALSQALISENPQLFERAHWLSPKESDQLINRCR